MFSFDILIPAAFPALALAHFVALLSPGPDFFLLTGYSIRYHFRGSALICLGIALGNGFYILIAIIGWSSIRDIPLLFSITEIAGAFYLLWLGYQLLKSHSQNIELNSASRPSLAFHRQLLVGFSSAVLNPKNALFYMSLMTVILGDSVTLTQQVFCGLWMFWVVLIWDLLIVILISYPGLQKLLNSKVCYIERLSGVVLISFSAGLFINRISQIYG